MQSIGHRRCCCKCCMYRVPHIFCASLFHAPHCLNIDSLRTPRSTTEYFHLKVAINDSNFPLKLKSISIWIYCLHIWPLVDLARLPRRDLPCSTGAARNFAWQRALLRTACRLRRHERGREGGGRGLCRVRVRQYTFTPHLGGRLRGCTAFYPPPRPQREK